MSESTKALSDRLRADALSRNLGNDIESQVPMLEAAELIDRQANEIEELRAQMNEDIATIRIKAKEIESITAELAGARAAIDAYHARVVEMDPDAAIGRTVLTKTVILDGSTEGMTILTLATDAEGFLGDAVRKAVGALAGAKELG